MNRSRTVTAVVLLISAAAVLSGCAGLANARNASDEASLGAPAIEGSVSLVVPNAAGGPNDTIARLLSPAMEEALDAKVQVLNVEGAGGQLGITQIADAKPDGTTVGFTNLPSTIALYVDPRRGATFDAASFTPIAQVTNSYLSIAVNSQSPYETLDDLIAAAKDRPGELTWGTGGVMSNDHLAALDFEEKTGTDFNIVHFDGGAAKYTALLAGDVDVAPGSGDALVTQAEAGAYRVLAVLGPEPLAALPEVPTTAELGVDVTQPNAFIISGPAGMPADVASALGAAIETALADSTVAGKMEKLGYVPMYADSQQVSELWAEMESMKDLFLKAAQEG